MIVIYGLTRGNWLNGFLAGLALAMAILPNEFPVVLTIFPALGAWRISQNRVLTRRMPAVETLGSATILCVDKTGTLTLNQMSVGQMVAFGDSVFQSYPYDLNLHERESLPEDVHGLIEYSILASQKDPFDPMEKAFKQLGDDYLSQTEHLHNDWRLVHEYPLSPVARESADLVLLDDDFSSIVQAVKSGRRIFDNLKKAMAYTLAIHVPIAGMSLIPVLFKWPLVLLPIHIAFLHLIIDPACSVVFEAEPPEANVMNRPPRNPKEPLFGRQMLTLSVMQGVGVLLILIIIFAIALYRKQGKLDARALAFTTLIVANLSLILTNRSWSRTIFAIVQAPNPALWWVIGGAIAFMGLALYIPVLRHLFRFSTLHPIDLGICLVGGIISVIWFEWLKVRKHLSKPN